MRTVFSRPHCFRFCRCAAFFRVASSLLFRGIRRVSGEARYCRRFTDCEQVRLCVAQLCGQHFPQVGRGVAKKLLAEIAEMSRRGEMKFFDNIGKRDIGQRKTMPNMLRPFHRQPLIGRYAELLLENTPESIQSAAAQLRQCVCKLVFMAVCQRQTLSGTWFQSWI